MSKRTTIPANDPDVYDRWFAAKVREALEEKGPAVPHQQVMDDAQNLIDDKLGR